MAGDRSSFEAAVPAGAAVASGTWSVLPAGTPPPGSYEWHRQKPFPEWRTLLHTTGNLAAAWAETADLLRGPRACPTDLHDAGNIELQLDVGGDRKVTVTRCFGRTLDQEHAECAIDKLAAHRTGPLAPPFTLIGPFYLGP